MAIRQTSAMTASSGQRERQTPHSGADVAERCVAKVPVSTSVFSSAASSDQPGYAAFYTAQPVYKRFGYFIFLGFYLLPLLLQPTTTWQWLINIFILLMFIAVWLVIHRSFPTPQWRWWSLLFAIALASAPLNSGALTLFSYSAFFIGLWLQGPRLLLGLAALLAIQSSVLWYFYPSGWLQGYGFIVALGVGLLGHVERMRVQHHWQTSQSKQELQALARTLERERIGRDLHDLLGHSLASIALKAELTELLLQQQQTDAALVHLQQLQQIARQSLQQVRQTVSGYQQQSLEVCVPALLAQLRSHGWQCEVEADLSLLQQVSPAGMDLIITELCTNLLKHSQGTRCQIRFSGAPSQWRLEFIDDGELDSLTPGHGLQGIAQRMQLVGGQFTWQLAPTRFILTWCSMT